MVFVSQNRIRGGRGRGRGIGEVSFEAGNSTSADRSSPEEFESRNQVAEELRITVGNEKYRDNRQESSARDSLGHRLGPPAGNYDRDYSSSYRSDNEQYRREAEAYGSSGHYESKSSVSNPFRAQPHDDYGRSYERETGDRRGFGASQESSRVPQGQQLFPASRVAGSAHSDSPHRTNSPSASSSTSTRPLKSILKKKSEQAEKLVETQKPVGLPGMSNYIDDIDDEEKFLYGDDDSNKKSGDRADNYGYQNRGHITGPDIRSAAQTWKPSAPSNTVTGIVSEFVSTQRNFSEQQVNQQPLPPLQYSQPASTASNASGGGDLWSMLAKSVQTVQQQQQLQPQQNVYSNQQQQQQQIYPAPAQPNPQPAQPVQLTQPAQEPETGHDPTIENILKSIGFDFDMSKRMQEKAKQAAGEVAPPKAKTSEDSQFGINHGASFIGSGMSHEDMRSSLGSTDKDQSYQPTRQDSREGDRYNRESAGRVLDERDRSRDYSAERRDSMERKRSREYEADRRDSQERKRGRSFEDEQDDYRDRLKTSYDMFSSPAKGTGQAQELLDNDLSPVSTEGSPPPPMFNLPPITIKRRSGLERNRSPGWDKNRSPERTIQVKRSSRSPSYTKSTSSYGKRSNRSRSPSREKDTLPRKGSPIIRRTITISPDFRKRMSPRRSRSPSNKRRSRSPGDRRRSSRSPGKRRSRSPGRRKSPGRGRSPRRSISPGRRRSPKRRSRSPKRRSRSPRNRSPNRRRSRSPRRRSLSPRGRKRGLSPRSSSRDKKLRRSSSRERRRRSRSKGRRSRSGSRNRIDKKDTFSSDSDSDIDGPANKNYFSSPLRMPGRPPNRFYDGPPVSQPPPGPPGGFGPIGPPPMFSQGPIPVPIGPPPPFGMPPPPFSGPPPMQPPGPVNYPPQLTYVVPTVTQPIVDTSIPPPGTFEIPLNLAGRSNDMPEAPTEEKKVYMDRGKREDQQNVEKREGNSNRTVLPPKSTSRDEDKDSSHARIVVIGNKSKTSKSSSSSSGKDTKKTVDPAKEKARIIKEKEELDNKINLLQSEFLNLKKQEEDLKSFSKESKENVTILEENNKLREEIKKELSKLARERKAFQHKHQGVLKDVPTKRDTTINPKKSDSTKKSDSSKKEGPTESKDLNLYKKESSKSQDTEFKVEKGRLMKHYFVDGGEHWCKACNIDISNIHDYVQHLSSYKHKQSLPVDCKPWKEGFHPNEGMIVNKNGVRVPIPGIEFMYPVTAYYCKLCKMFFGDVTSGVDHFRCESHYSNYQNYCKENPYHEKKIKEEKDAYLKRKTEERTKKEEEREKSKLTVAKVREKERQKRQDTDARKRETEKTGGNSDVSENIAEQLNADKVCESDESESDKSKIAMQMDKSKNLKSSSGKKPPMLPPWQPVGKKVEEPAKSTLDSFLTTNSSGGKVPVISEKEKKKVSAQDVLKAYHEKKKEKEQKEREAKQREIEAQLDKERKEKEDLRIQLLALKNEQAIQLQLEALKSKKEIAALKSQLAKEKESDVNIEIEDMDLDEPEKQSGELEDLAGVKPPPPPPPPPPSKEEEDLVMMGIDPQSVIPLAHIKPPPPRSQNITHPGHKAHSTVSKGDVHNLFLTSSSLDSKKSEFVGLNVDSIANIPLPASDVDSSKIDNKNNEPPPKPSTPRRHWKVFFEPIEDDGKKNNQENVVNSIKDTKEGNVNTIKDTKEGNTEERSSNNGDDVDKKSEFEDTELNDKPDVSPSNDIESNDKPDVSPSNDIESNDKPDVSPSNDIESNDKPDVSPSNDVELNDKPDVSLSTDEGTNISAPGSKDSKEDESNTDNSVKNENDLRDEKVDNLVENRNEESIQDKNAALCDARTIDKVTDEKKEEKRDERGSVLSEVKSDDNVGNKLSDEEKEEALDVVVTVDDISDEKEKGFNVEKGVMLSEIKSEDKLSGETKEETLDKKESMVNKTKKGDEISHETNEGTLDTQGSECNETKSDDIVSKNIENEETVEEDEPLPEKPKRGGKRGRGRGRGRRGRGRGSRGASAPKRSTRSTRSSVANVEIENFEDSQGNVNSPAKPSGNASADETGEAVEQVDNPTESVSNVKQDSQYTEMVDLVGRRGVSDVGVTESSLDTASHEGNVSVECNIISGGESSVEVIVGSENNPGLETRNKEIDVLLSGVNMVEDTPSFEFGSPRKTRRRGSGDDRIGVENTASDAEDNASEMSGMSMHMNSDFEVVDDIDDITDVMPL